MKVTFEANSNDPEDIRRVTMALRRVMYSLGANDGTIEVEGDPAAGFHIADKEWRSGPRK